jgi:hypothetical protein
MFEGTIDFVLPSGGGAIWPENGAEDRSDNIRFDAAALRRSGIDRLYAGDYVRFSVAVFGVRVMADRIIVTARRLSLLRA